MMQVPQVGRVLPGPAGKLQELAAAGALQQATPQTLGLKPGSVTGLSSSQAATQLDAAFLSSSWGAAEARADEDAVAAGPVRTIKYAKEMGVGKVPRMLLLLSTFHPSGGGSAFSKVKDPSGIMGAAIHSSALQQQQQQLGPGCVLLVQNVSVLTPNPGSSYLAVTADNIVQVWGPDQPSRNIRHTTHQPVGGATQQRQQQQPGQQQQQLQQQPQQQAAGQQHQGLFRWAPPGQQQQQQRPGAGAAASGADNRQTSSFFPPPSPDIMSVLNQMSRGGSGAAAAANTPQPGPPGAGGLHQPPQQGLQQQQWQRQSTEQQGAVSPALSGAAPHQQQQHTQAQQQQQQWAGPGSMPPPPPRAPAGPSQQQLQGQQLQWQQQQGQQQQGQQQQQVGAGHMPLGQLLSQDASSYRAPPMQQQQQGQGQQQQQALHRHSSQQQPQGQGHAAGAALFRGLSQPTNTDPGLLASAVPIGSSLAAPQGPGSVPSTQYTAPHTMSQPGRLPAGSQQCGSQQRAPALDDDDEDVEVDENIVAAIFGSQVPKPMAPLVPPQPQNQQQAVPGRTALGQHTPSVSSTRFLTGGTQQQSSQVASANSPAVFSGSGQLTGAGGRTAVTPGLGTMRPPTASLRPTQQLQQQQWGLQGSRQQLSEGRLGKQIGSLGGTVLGKRPVAVSLLDDLVSGDLDDL